MALGGLRIIRPWGDASTPLSTPPPPPAISILDTAAAAAATKSFYNIERYLKKNYTIVKIN